MWLRGSDKVDYRGFEKPSRNIPKTFGENAPNNSYINISNFDYISETSSFMDTLRCAPIISQP